jgi:nitrogen-specific signal transduction histidine kinase
VSADTDTLFLPFYTTRAGHGGIGLAIVRQVAFAHGGTISIKTLDPGTRFKLLIP